MVTNLTVAKPLLVFCGGYLRYALKKNVTYFCSNSDNACEISLLLCVNFFNFQGTTIMFCFDPESFMKTSSYYNAQ